MITVSLGMFKIKNTLQIASYQFSRFIIAYVPDRQGLDI